MLANAGVVRADPVYLTNLTFLAGSTASTEVLNTAGGQLLAGNTVYQYNIINDSTGAKLTTDNGDTADITLSGSSTSGALGVTRAGLGALSAASPLAALPTGRLGFQHSFTGSPSSTNPGSINKNTLELRFTSNLNVTSATFNFSSLNTFGTTWEYSVIQFLDASGNPFSALTSQSWTLGAASQYSAAGSGFSGSAGTGNYIAASTGTVTGVGSSLAGIGASGVNDNMATFGYSTVGLTAGTSIGGIRFTTYQEDVRGTVNGESTSTSSLLDFTISGAVVPEPSSILLILAGVGLLAFLRKKQEPVS